MNKFSFQNLKIFFDKYESTLSALTLVSGFIFDYFTLDRVDYLWDNIFIIIYLCVAGTSILVINLYEEGRLRNNFVEHVYEFLPFTLQFAFGGLFSAFTIFYSKSASFVSSGIFVLILFTLLVGNEFFKKRYQKLVFQVSLYFVAIFAFSIYFLPVLLRDMGVAIFLSSGVVSLGLISAFIFLISYFASNRYKESHKHIILTILSLYLSINLLYFLNIIPPIPLSLTIGDVYHLVERQANGSYVVMGEADAWREKLNLSQRVHLLQEEPVYVFSSVFAPADLNITIIHDWQYFDEARDEWVSANRIVFPIRGGRNAGYRGFSKKENVFAGKWRVDIKTVRGQVVGRVRFNIEIGDTIYPLNKDVL